MLLFAIGGRRKRRGNISRSLNGKVWFVADLQEVHVCIIVQTYLLGIQPFLVFLGLLFGYLVLSQV